MSYLIPRPPAGDISGVDSIWVANKNSFGGGRWVTIGQLAQELPPDVDPVPTPVPTPTPIPTPVPTPTPSTTGKIILGGYTGYDGVAGENSFITSIGGNPADSILMDFTDGTSWDTISTSFNSDLAGNFKDWPGNVCIGVDLLPNPPAGGPTAAIWAAQTQGAGDAALTSAAKEIAALFPNAIIRLGWEFNADWMPWGVLSQSDGSVIVTGPEFVAYWHRVVGLFRAVSPGFKFLWNPTRGGTPDITQYKPDPADYDIVGDDIYNQEWGLNPWSESGEWNTMLTENAGINEIESIALKDGKAIAYPEWSCSPAASGSNTSTSPGDDPTFVLNMLTTAITQAKAGFTVYLWPWNQGGDAFSSFKNATAELVTEIKAAIAAGLLIA